MTNLCLVFCLLLLSFCSFILLFELLTNTALCLVSRQKFTKFVHNVARLLPFNLLKANLRSANPLSNAKGKSKGCYGRCLRTFLPCATKGVIVNSVKSGVSGLNVTKIVYNVHSFYLIFWNRNCDIAIHFQMAAQQNRLVHKKMPIYHSPVMAATSMTTFLAAWHTQIIYCLYLNLSVVCKLWFIEKLIRDESIKYFWLYIKSAAVPTQQLECLEMKCYL